MQGRDLALAVIPAIAAFGPVTLAVTRLTNHPAELLVSFPWGCVIAASLGVFTYTRIGHIKPRKRPLGVALVAYGVVSLAVFAGLFAAGLLTESRQFWLGVGVSVVVGAVVYGWYRQPDREVPL